MANITASLRGADDDIALRVRGGVSLTRGWVRELVGETAERLTGAGVTLGARVAMAFPNSPEARPAAPRR